MEETAFQTSREVINTQNVNYHRSLAAITVGSTRGFVRTEQRGFCSFSMSAISRRGDETRSGWYWSQNSEPNAVDWVSVGREAALRASSLLGSFKIPGGKYPILFDRMAFIGILGFLEEILSAEMVIKGMSVFKDKAGDRVAPEIFSLTDHPGLEGGLYRSVFDDEGVPRERYQIIDRGKLMGFLHNSMTARRMGAEPTGNATRGSFKETPVPGGTNLHVNAKGIPVSEMISSIGQGIYVQDVMGMHTADSVSGDFSVGVSGQYIRNGGFEHPVCEVTVSGNILDVLEGIRGVGDDLIFVGSTGSPSILVEGLSLSGK
jgi:PmbA protein